MIISDYYHSPVTALTVIVVLKWSNDASINPLRSKKSPTQKQTRGVPKKLEAHRQYLLQHQLEGDKWDTVDSSKGVSSKGEKGAVPPPPPIAPPNAFSGSSRADVRYHRSKSPDPSVSSQESSPVIPQPRSPPPPIQPSGFRGGIELRVEASERRTSVSTMHTEKTEHFERESRTCSRPFPCGAFVVVFVIQISFVPRVIYSELMLFL